MDCEVFGKSPRQFVRPMSLPKGWVAPDIVCERGCNLDDVARSAGGNESLCFGDNGNVVPTMTDAKLAIGARRRAHHHLAIANGDGHWLFDVDMGSRFERLDDQGGVRVRWGQHMDHVR